METIWPENLSPDRRKVIQELVQGRDFANQLRDLLGKSMDDDGGLVKSEDLVTKILDSFSNTLSILKTAQFDEGSQNLKNTQMGSPYGDGGRKSEDSGDSIKSSVQKDRRGCYKRRKCEDSWTIDSPKLVDDGHAWRKYGQKEILNAKYPRNYFRCTHKFDQLCQATKQVQKIQEDPPVHRTTYYGHHTCKNLLKASQLILDRTTSRDSSVLLSFDSSSTSKQAHSFFSSFPSQLAVVKQESKDDVLSDLTYNNNHSASSDDYLVSPDLSAFESSAHMPVLSSDHGDVIDSVDFDSFFQSD